MPKPARCADEMGQKHTVLPGLLSTDYTDSRRLNEACFHQPNSPALVPPVINDANHDWADRGCGDRLAATRLGECSLFSARHLHQPDQIDHRTARFLDHCRRNRWRGRIAKDRRMGLKALIYFELVTT